MMTEPQLCINPRVLQPHEEPSETSEDEDYEVDRTIPISSPVPQPKEGWGPIYPESWKGHWDGELEPVSPISTSSLSSPAPTPEDATWGNWSPRSHSGWTEYQSPPRTEDIPSASLSQHSSPAYSPRSLPLTPKIIKPRYGSETPSECLSEDSHPVERQGLLVRSPSPISQRNNDPLITLPPHKCKLSPKSAWH